jgi:hypothetical protein
MFSHPPLQYKPRFSNLARKKCKKTPNFFKTQDMARCAQGIGVYFPILAKLPEFEYFFTAFL